MSEDGARQGQEITRLRKERWCDALCSDIERERDELLSVNDRLRGELKACQKSEQWVATEANRLRDDNGRLREEHEEDVRSMNILRRSRDKAEATIERVRDLTETRLGETRMVPAVEILAALDTKEK